MSGCVMAISSGICSCLLAAAVISQRCLFAQSEKRRVRVGQACSRGGLVGMLPVEHNDPVNAKILAVSEDKIEGFVREPFEEIANRSGVGVEDVMARIAAMLRAGGTIRGVRQTLLATNLAEGALVAWKVPDEKIDAAFDWIFQRDPFSGNVVIRSTRS